MEPKTLKEAVEYYSNPQNCRDAIIAKRWPTGKVTCPRCGSENVKFSEKYNRWQCGSHHTRRQFTLKTGTIFNESPVPLDKWLIALWMLCNCKNGVSSWEIHRAIGVTQKTAWFMLHRLREVLQNREYGTKMGGEDSGAVEVDESFVGGKLRNMHKDRRARFAAESGHTGGSTGKTIVVGMLDRDAREVRAKVVPDVKRETLQAEILKNVKYGSTVYTDDAVPYDRLNWHYIHDVVNHAETYVKGQVHTNGMENFWSLMKRTLKGTYVAVEPFHLDRYLDEQVFRFNNRKNEEGKKLTDGERFNIALSQVAGRRLTYQELTGKLCGETF
jgi:transposase-like protein